MHKVIVYFSEFYSWVVKLNVGIYFEVVTIGLFSVQRRAGAVYIQAGSTIKVSQELPLDFKRNCH